MQRQVGFSRAIQPVSLRNSLNPQCHMVGEVSPVSLQNSLHPMCHMVGEVCPGSLREQPASPVSHGWGSNPDTQIFVNF